MTTITRSKAKSTTSVVEEFKQHLVLKIEAATLTARADKLKSNLKALIPTLPGSYENESGSKFWDLPETLTLLGQSFKGMELRASTSTTFNEDEAEKILKKKGVYEEALSTYVDQDKVYRLVADGKITEKELDKMFETSDVRYAFWPVKGEVL